MTNPYEHFSAEAIASATRCPLHNVRETWPRLVEQLAHCGINDRPTQLAMIGNVAHETASRFAPIREFKNADGSIPAYWHNYGGGANYHGRGYIQITHLSNYARYGPKIAALWGADPAHPDFDLVGSPDRALDPDISAAIAALYFRDHGGDGQARIPQAARRGEWHEVRRLIWGADPLDFPIGHAGRDAHEKIVRIITTLGGTPPMTTPLPFNPDAPIDQQPDHWSCALQTVQWLLRAIGRNPDASNPAGDPWLRSQLVPGIISPDVGLRDGSGGQLVAWLNREYGAEMGFVANASPVSFDDVHAGAGVNPTMVGGHRWGAGGHWAGVRRADGPDALLLANPADGYTGIQQRITRAEWNNRAPWDCIWIDRMSAPAPEPPAPPPVTKAQVVERLRALLAMQERHAEKERSEMLALMELADRLP